MRVFRQIALVALLTVGCYAMAATEAVTDDGQRVRLLDDFTWEYIESVRDDIAPEITIEVLSKVEEHGNCRIGLKLHNKASYRIVSIVPQFAAYLVGDIRFDNVFVSFQDVKPTLSQYQELEFRKVSCVQLSHVLVHGGDRCNMDDLTKYTGEKGECLRRVEVLASPVINISK